MSYGRNNKATDIRVGIVTKVDGDVENGVVNEAKDNGNVV